MGNKRAGYPGYRLGCRAGLWLLAALLGACGSDGKPGAATQVLAKVNGDEITVHQLNDRLGQIPLSPGVDAKAAQKQILELLIDEQLLVQRALADKLDRDPPVLQALERTRRQILAQAEIERSAGKLDIAPEEAAKFYAGNPDLFEKRRIYTFHQFLLDTPKLEPAVRSRLDAVKTPAETAALLNAAGIKFRDEAAVRAAELLPMEVLARVARMGRGDMLLMSEGGQVLLMQLVDSTLEPLDLKRANPAIQAYLAAGKKKEIALNLVKDLRSKAKIDYVGGAAVPTTGATEPTPAAAAPKNDDYIHKGISGLKK